jgi:hypothetical protein
VTEHERDPVVARALHDLPVPDHGPGFWEDLDRRLADEEPETAPPPADLRVVTSELPALQLLAPAPTASAGHRARFLAVAAAIALVAVGTGVLLRGGGGPPAEQAATTVPLGSAPGAGSRPAPPPPVPAASTTVADPPQVRATVATPDGAVLAWVHALGSGDTETAAALLGPSSRRYIESLGTDPERFSFDFQEGFGAWAGAPDLAATTVAIPDAGVVVVLSGTYAGEGSATTDRMDAVPAVEVAEGRWAVEPVAFGSTTSQSLKMVRPEPHPEGWWSGQPPDAVFQATSEVPVTFWFSLDGSPAERSDDGSWDPPGLLDTRYHVLVVAAIGEDTFTALAGSFLVER